MAPRSGKKTEKQDKTPKKKKEKADRKTIALDLGRSKKEQTPAENPEIVFGAVTPDAPPAYEPLMNEGGAFVAGVRSADPVLTIDDSAKDAGWKKDLVLNISGAVLLMAFMSLFCMVTYSIDLIPFLIPGALVFLGITITESVKPGRTRWIVCAVAAALLVASIAVFHNAVGGGLAELINQFYSEAEQAQAYLYDRLPDIEGGSTSLGAVWASCLIGLLAALPPARFRRDALTLVALIMMFAFAYYGLLPSAACVAVMLAALLVALSRGNILSSLPILLSVMLIFGAIMLIYPGENMTISRIDENFRDKFALNSRLIENPDIGTDDLSGLDDPDDTDIDDTSDDDDVFSGIPRVYVVIAAAVLIIAAAAVVLFLLWNRINRKRKALREGIDSHDPRTAVTAMFPYTVRWLRAGGVETGSRPFSELTPYVAGEFSQDYADRYRDMYLLWREAAYSDHDIDDTDRSGMADFLKDTTEMIKEKFTFADRLRAMIKYSL